MQWLTIQNILASILVIFSLILCVVTFIRKHQGDTGKKLIGIFLIAGLAILSNNVASYLLSIVVIATQITTLDFIIRALCIIKGTDSNAIKALLVSPLSKEDYEKKYEDAVKQESSLSASDISQQTTDAVNIIKKSYNKLFSWLQSELGLSIERDVKINIGDEEWVVDGFVRIGEKIKLLNVKISLGPAIVYKPFLQKACEKATKIRDNYGANVELELIFVGNYTEGMTQEIINTVCIYRNINTRFIIPELIGISCPWPDCNINK